ncbi:cation transporter [Azospirillum sp. RWY-5-1]|uniref:Cation transporter n=1 Tax=Azospirillum oleiclasticum TaxID=2735135 RepID=A0ABX2T799_9PROT|nr:cation transporter [Azospirillum oleiclasticum]NYZ20192.1 cation transporter [Azospirillum oleiclasticum]
MSGSCCGGGCSASKPVVDPVYRRVLLVALAVNAGMFLVEIVAGTAAGSVSLQADALDFLGDAANYVISLLVLGMALRWRARAALIKGVSLGVLGLWVAGQTLSNALAQTVPEAPVMGVVGLMALAANLGVAALLYAHRHGDANRQSVWICSRNDAIANVAVLAAAAGVFGTATGWPDIAVAAVIAGLSVSGAVRIVRQAAGELRPVAA